MKLKRILQETIRTDWANDKNREKAIANSNVVLDHFGDDRDIRSITYADVLEFIDAQRATGVTGSTINRKLSCLSKFYTVAKRFDAKIMRLELPRQKEGKPRQRIYTDDECNALVNYPWSKPERRDLTVLFMDTGVRPGEITKGVWSVKGDEITLLDTKNGDDRTLVLTPEAKAAALRLRKFIDSGAKLSYSSYYDEFKRARKRLGLGEDCVVYTMRHSVITKLAENTDNVLLIQKWAGHKDLATTQRYVKATRKGMENLANVLRRN